MFSLIILVFSQWEGTFKIIIECFQPATLWQNDEGERGLTKEDYRILDSLLVVVWSLLVGLDCWPLLSPHRSGCSATTFPGNKLKMNLSGVTGSMYLGRTSPSRGKVSASSWVPQLAAVSFLSSSCWLHFSTFWMEMRRLIVSSKLQTIPELSLSNLMSTCASNAAQSKFKKK